MSLPELKLLIADDEVHVRTGLCVAIDWKALQIGKVFAACDGGEALDLCIKHRIELVVSDIKMPGLSGIDLGRRLTEIYRPVKILLISGFAEFDFAKDALKIGVVDYLLKPVNIGELVSCVTRMRDEIYAELSVREIFPDRERKGIEYHQKVFEHDERLDIERNQFNPIILEAIDYINNHYDEKIAVDSVAGHIGVSCNYFSGSFKSEIGMAFTDYLNHIRITHAKRMLKNTMLHVCEISDHVGFNDYKYFSTVFKKLEGCSPTEYRISRVRQGE
jgi:two-component system response regulator YesN